MKVNSEKFLENRATAYGLFRIKPLVSELRVHGISPSGLAYAGTIDSIALVQGKLTVLDLKTGRRQSPKHGVQVAAYAHALSLSRAGVLYMTDSGTPGLRMANVKLGIEVFDKLLIAYNALSDEALVDVFEEEEIW